MGLLPADGRGRTVVSHPKTVGHATKRRGVHCRRLFLLDGRVPSVEDRHGRLVEHVVLFGAVEVVRHAARRRRVNGRATVVAVHADFPGLPIFIDGRLPRQAFVDLYGQFGREVHWYLLSRRVVHPAALARGRRRTAPVAIRLVRQHQQTITAFVAADRWQWRRGPLFPRSRWRRRPGSGARAVVHGQTVNAGRGAPAPAPATRVASHAKFVGRWHWPRRWRSAVTVVGPFGCG